MVRTITTRKADPWRRAKKNSRKDYQLSRIYPPLWDSTIIYYTYTVQLTLPATQGYHYWEADARAPSFYAAFYTDTRKFFERYRVEAMTVFLSPLQNLDNPILSLESAVIHSNELHNMALADEIKAIRKDKTYMMHNRDDTLIKRRWKFDTFDTDELDFDTIPTAQQALAYTYGGVFLYAVFQDTAGFGQPIVYANVTQKWKVRLRGRQGASFN